MSGDKYQILHDGLTIDLISTPRKDLMTCDVNDSVVEVMNKNKLGYDYIPVTTNDQDKPEQIIGLYYASKEHRDEPEKFGRISKNYVPLSENYFIGDNTSILHYLSEAVENPCRLVVSKTGIQGLVTIFDMQKLPVRTAIFALITGLELTLSNAITEACSSDQWLKYLSDGRRAKTEKKIEAISKAGAFVDAILYTELCDKLSIAKKIKITDKITKTNYKDIVELRNILMHASMYAETKIEALKTCATVIEIIRLRHDINGD